MSEKIMGEFSINNEGTNYAGGVNVEGQTNTITSEFKPVENNLPTKVGFWTKFKNFWLQEINVELTPKQQKVEDEINEFLHQEVTWQGVKDFWTQEISFGKKKNK